MLVVWHVSGPKRFAGDRHGFQEWIKYVARLQREVGYTIKLMPTEFMPGDRHASVFMPVSRERNGRVHKNEAVQVCRFDGDHIAEVWFLDATSPLSAVSPLTPQVASDRTTSPRARP